VQFFQAYLTPCMRHDSIYQPDTVCAGSYIDHFPLLSLSSKLCMALASMFDIRFDTGLVFTSVHTYFYSYFFFIMHHTKIVVKIVLGDLLHEGIM
jgi:hypothetical protein